MHGCRHSLQTDDIRHDDLAPQLYCMIIDHGHVRRRNSVVSMTEIFAGNLQSILSRFKLNLAGCFLIFLL